MLVDLSHPIFDGMPAYPGLPPAVVGPILDHETSRDRYQGKAEFYLGRIELACNSGTYLDAPFHRYPDGDDLSRVGIERVAGLPGMVIDAADEAGPVPLDLAGEDLAGKAVLIRTGRDRAWGDEERYWGASPFISAASADALVEAGIALLGVDFGNVDDTGDPERPVHTRLLAAGIPIVENLRGLEQLPEHGFRFTAAPLAVVRGATMPVRAFAEAPD